MRYRIDETHPSVSAVLSAGALLPWSKSMLRVIRETVPVQLRIWLDTAENKDAAHGLRWRGPSAAVSKSPVCCSTT